MTINSKKVILILILIGIIFSISLGVLFYHKETQKIKVVLKKDVNNKVLSLEREILLNFEALYALNGLFISSKNVTSLEFKKMALGILTRHNDIQALEWIPKVTHKNREIFENIMNKDFPNFEITQRETQGSMIRALNREFYFPVSYIEPFLGNEIALGFDLASNKKRLNTLELSRDSGKLLSTESINLVQEKSNQKAFLTFLPVYTNYSISTVKKRLNLKGFILGVFRVSDMVNSAISKMDISVLNFELIDITSGKEDVLFTNYKNKKSLKVRNKDFVHKKKLIKVAGRELIVIASATNEYIKLRRTNIPYLISLLGVIFVLLGAFYTYYILKRKLLVENLVQKRTSELEVLNNKLQTLSKTDTLTNIANRRYFDEYFTSEWNRAIRDKTPLSLIMLDIDYFKLYNDTYGHLKGDNCLKEVSFILKNSTKRDSDLVSRYGGEEFIIILPNTKEPSGLALKCLENIKEAKLEHKSSKVSKYISLSIGVVTITPCINDNKDGFINSVDEALYEAKEKGRNRIVEK